MKNRCWQLIEVLLLLALLVSAVGKVGEEKLVLDYDASELLLNGGVSEAYIDESSGYSGIFTYGPYIDLPEGSYLLTVRYETDTDGNRISLMGDPIQFTISDDQLPSNRRTAYAIFHLTGDAHRFEARTEYSGEGYLRVDHIAIETLTSWDTVFWLLAAQAAWLLVGALRSGKGGRRFGRHGVMLALLAGVVLFACTPCFSQWLFSGHDMAFHLDRIEGIANGLRAGQFPVRVHPSTLDGYGYAAAMMYPELFLYLPALLRLAGVSLVTAVQVLVLFMTAVCAYGTYFAAWRMFGSRYGALCVSVLYTLSTYRLSNVFTRFALGEALAMTFLPLVLYGLYEIFYGDAGRWKWAALGYTCVLQSHIITTELLLMYSVLFALFHLRAMSRGRMLALGKAAGVTAAVNLWFIVPFLDMYLHAPLCVDQITARNLQESGVQLSQLLEVFPDAIGGNRDVFEGFSTEMPLALGLPVVAGVLLAVWQLLTTREADWKGGAGKLLRSYLFFFLLSVALASAYFPWDAVTGVPLLEKVFQVAQYVWRYLSFATLHGAFLGGVALGRLLDSRSETRNVATGVILAVCLLCTGQFLDSFMQQSEILLYRDVPYDRTGQNVVVEYTYEGTDQEAIHRRGSVVLPGGGDIQVGQVEKNGTSMEIACSGTSGYLEAPLLYYPGYEAMLNGAETLEVERGDNNLLRIQLPEGWGEGIVSVRYVGKAGWNAALAVSLGTVAAVAGWTWLRRFRGGEQGSSRIKTGREGREQHGDL